MILFIFCTFSESDLESKIESCRVPAAVRTLDDTTNIDTFENTVYSCISNVGSECELTRDNKELSVGLESQQHTHAVDVHANDSNERRSVVTVTVKNPLCIQEHLQTEAGVEIHDNDGVSESHKPSVNEFSQQWGINVMIADQGSVVENVFDFEAVQNKTEVEPDGKQASIGHTVDPEEEQLSSTITQLLSGMDPGPKRPQENLSSRDKESLPNLSKCHAHNQPREMVPVKRDQVSVERSRSDEMRHEYYNIVHLPDSVNKDQHTKHGHCDSSSGNEVSAPSIDSESKFTSNSEESGHDPVRESEESDPTREREESYPTRDSKESDPTRESEERDPTRENEESDPTRDSEESDPTRKTELTTDNNEGELTRDNEEPSINKQTQWHAHAAQVHTNDLNEMGNVVQNPQLHIQEHLLTESELKTDDDSLKESQKISTTIVDEFNQQQGMDVVLAGQGDLVDSDLFCTEAMTIETKVEPDKKQVSVSDTVKEEQVSATTEINQSITTKDVAILRQTTANENQDDFKEEYSSHNVSNIDLPLPERDVIAKSTVRLAIHDSLEDVKTSKRENMKAEDKRELQYHNEHQSVLVKERKQSLQTEKVSISENKLASYQSENILEPKIKPLEMIVKGEPVTVQTFLQTASTPRTKPGLETNTDVRHGMEGSTSLTPSTSSKTAAVSHSKGFADSLDVHDYEEIPDLTEMHVGMDPATSWPQENVSSKDKGGSLTRSKRHAHNQPREWVTLKRRQVSIKRSRSDEKIHDYYNVTWLPDSVDTDQATSHKPHLSNNIWSYGTLPTKRKEPSAKISKEELRRRYRHRPPPSKDPAPPPQTSVSDKEDSVAIIINPTASDHDESNLPELDNISTVHEYEDIDLEDFRNAVKCRDPSATSKLKSKEALRKLYKHRAPPMVPTKTSTECKENILSENRQTEATPSSEKAQEFHKHSSPVKQKSQELIQAESTLPSEKQLQSLSDSTKTIQSTKEEEEKNAIIHGQLKDEPTTSMLKSPHSNTDSSSGHLLSVSDPDDDYMPLIPKRRKKKVNYDYETLNFQQ